MEWIDTIAKVVHVAAGITALVLAPVAMIVRKGGPAHRRWGKIYFWAMAAIFVTALVMLAFRVNIFLLAVSLLSFYSALSGYRTLGFKRLDRPIAGTLDWAAALIALAGGLAVLVWGAVQLSGGVGADPIPILGVIFGVMIMWQARGDMRLFRNPPADKNYWWYRHMSQMIGSYIGATTAFLVQTVAPRLVQAGLPLYLVALVWIVPTLIGSPGIAIWVNYYRREFARRQAGRVPTRAATPGASESSLYSEVQKG